MSQLRRLLSNLLTSLLIAMVFIAFLLALAHQMSSAELTESALRKEAWNFRPKDITLEFMVQVLGDRGIDTLKHASGIEVLRVTEGLDELEVAPTGIMLDEAAALKTTCILLHHKTYSITHVNPFVDPDRPPPPPPPMVGLRFRDGASILDFLFQPSFRRPVSVRIRDRAGDTVFSSGGVYMQDPELKILGEWLLRQADPARGGR